MPTPKNIGDYNVDSFAEFYRGGRLYVRVTRDGQVGEGSSTKSQAEALRNAVKNLESGGEVEPPAPEPEPSVMPPEPEPSVMVEQNPDEGKSRR